MGQDAAGARLRVRGDQASLLRRQLAGAWTACDAMTGALAIRDRGVGALLNDAAIQLAERDYRIRNPEADLRKAKRDLAVHENYNNPSRIATMFAKMRREFRAMDEVRGAGPLVQVCTACGAGSVCHACSSCGSCGACDVYAMGCGRSVCGTCGAGGSCYICGVCDMCGVYGTGTARPHAAPDRCWRDATPCPGVSLPRCTGMAALGACPWHGRRGMAPHALQGGPERVLA